MVVYSSERAAVRAANLAALAGTDLPVSSQPDSGKTAAFMLPPRRAIP